MNEIPKINTQINIKEEILKYTTNWKWFVLGVFLSVFSAYIYLRYSIPQYKASSTILVKDDRKGNLASELSAFSDLGMLSNIKDNVDNEIEVIKSRTLIEKTINELELDILYLHLGRVKSEEIYGNSAIKFVLVEATDAYRAVGHYYKFEKYSDAFVLYDAADTKIGAFKFGEKIKVEGAVITILRNNDITLTIDKIGIQTYPVNGLVESFKNRLSVSTLSKNTSVIELSFIDPVKGKAVDFLDKLIENYNEDAISDKQYVSENTSKFIEKRLEIIAQELGEVEKDVEKFKKENQVTDIVSEANLFLDNASVYEKSKLETTTQLKVVESMLDYVVSNTQNDLIPANIITQEQGAAGLISEYNQLVLERNKLLKSAGLKNAVVKTLNNKISALQQNIAESLRQLKRTLQIQNSDLVRQNAMISGKIAKIPTQERQFRDIDRKQHVKEALFLYLLEKREEMAISFAVTAPNAKVIDRAIASNIPVSPNKKVIFLGSFLIGLLLPFGVIYVNDLLDTKIKLRSDIEKNTTLPFLGEIPKLTTGQLLIEYSNRTSTAEALRIVRTNLEFLLNEVEENAAKVIFLTSTFPKEGKTFVSVNLASIIAQSDKKVLLIGMDVRNPKLDDYLIIPQKGLTNYIADKNQTPIEKYIVSADGIENLSILPSGVIPPNPAELLMNKKVGEMFEELKQNYDYIIVDTAPVSLVTDTLIVAKYADAFVYVARANFLDKRMLELPQKLYNENKLPNMSILLNDTDGKSGYGYGYGYGVELNKETWFQKIKNKIIK